MDRGFINLPANQGVLHYPTRVYQYEEGWWSFPMLEDSASYGLTAEQEAALSDESDDECDHPIRAAIKNGGTIESVVTGNEWDDDHCTCMNAVITVDGKRYGVSFWWLARSGVKLLHHAEGGNVEALANLKTWILAG